MRIALETRNRLALDRTPQQPLDIAQQRIVFRRDERHRFSLGAGTAGATDPVHIVFGHVRQIEIDDVRQFDDVEAACSDIGRHQRLQGTGLEPGQRPRTRVLALVAMNRQRRNAVLRQLLGQPVGAVLGAREDEHLEPAMLADQM